MKTLSTSILILTICLIHAYGQNSGYQFAEPVFKKKYKKMSFERYNRKILKINANTFRHGEKVLTIHTEDNILLGIFSNGILHPDIMVGKHTNHPLSKSQLDTMSANAKVFYNLSRNDSTVIGNLQQLHSLNPDSKTKRFMFWLYRTGMANPTECYFELYNDGWTRKMSTEQFMKGSKLTFYYQGTIIL